MKVVMLQDVGGVGQRGTVVNVSDGYALNFLIPHGKAEQATPQKEAEVKHRMLAEGAKKQEEEAKLHEAISSLSGKELRFAVRASEKGGLFKAITVADIVRMIFEQKKVRVPEGSVVLEKPIKEVGDHTVQIRKGSDSARIRIVVAAL